MNALGARSVSERLAQMPKFRSPNDPSTPRGETDLKLPCRTSRVPEREAVPLRALAGRAGLMFLLSLLGVMPICGCRRSEPSPAEGVRVVSLAPSLTEIVCAVGGREYLVGRTTACNYPEDVDTVAVIGGFGVPSIEKLVAAQPTLVLDVDLADEAIGPKLTSIGIRRERIPCRAIGDIPPAIRNVGALIGRGDAADVLATEIESALASCREGTITNRPRVYVEIWHDPYMSAGSRSFLSELINLAGGMNVGDCVKQDYFRVSPEWVVAQNPDIILCMYMVGKDDVAGEIARRPAWRHIAAVRRGAVFGDFNNDIVLRPGPRVLSAVEAIRSCLAEAARK